MSSPGGGIAALYVRSRDRFWHQVDVRSADECWNWTGPVHGSGYDYFWIGRWYNKSGNIDAHRFSAELHLTDYSLDLHVCHTCDNAACVNPDHLFMGTQTDNVRDMVAKGRAMWGGLCKRGHDLSVTGVTCNKGRGRRCSICWEEMRKT